MPNLITYKRWLFVRLITISLDFALGLTSSSEISHARFHRTLAVKIDTVVLHSDLSYNQGTLVFPHC